MFKTRSVRLKVLPVAGFLVCATIGSLPAGANSSLEDDPVPADAELRACTIVGTPGPDWILGTDSADVICAGGGDDVITSLDGDDVVLGGPGADILDNSSGKTIWVDYDADTDVVSSDGSGTVVGIEGSHLRREVERTTQLIEQRRLLADLQLIAPKAVLDGLSEFSTADQSTEPLRRSELQLERDRTKRGQLGVDSAVSATVLAEAANNGSVSSYGVPLSDLELKRVEVRLAQSRLIPDVERAAEAAGLRSGVFFDPAQGQIVVNVPADTPARTDLAAEAGVPISVVKFRAVKISLAEIDNEVRPLIEEVQEELASSAAELLPVFDQSDYVYDVTIVPAAPERVPELSALVEGLNKKSEYLRFSLDAPEPASAEPTCGFNDCYSLMPGMRIRNVPHAQSCTAGLIVDYSGGIGVMTNAHCDETTYDLRWDSAHAVTLRETSLERENSGTGEDHQIYSVDPTGRQGAASRTLMNGVLTSPSDHSNLLSGTFRVSEGSWICKTGWRTAQELGSHVECGSVDSMGDLAPGIFSSGYIQVEDVQICKGDSGGPFWTSISGLRFSVGLARGVYNGGFDVIPDVCGDDTELADITRALQETGSTFRDPAGHETTRRAAQRYYEILFDREPDTGGYDYYDWACSTQAMQDIAWEFTVAGGKPEFAGRFPMAGTSYTAKLNTRERVNHMYWSLLDRTPSSAELGYWGYKWGSPNPDPNNNFVWGSNSSTTASREARIDYLFWIVITNQGQPEFVNRMNGTGAHGSPPMCQTGW